MGAMVIGALRVDLGLETSAFMKGSSQAQKEAAALAKRMQDVGSKFQAIGKNMTLGITLPLAAMAAQAVKGAQEQRQAMAQVEASLKSMGNVSGKTAAELAKTADALEMNSLFAADEILSKLTANLLTFGNISGEVFDRTQQAAVDMATKMKTDVQSAALLLGKALNDPVKGAGKLSKAGIQLSDTQKEQIKTFTALGQTAKAQSIILDEVEKQFRGSAKAAADTDPMRQAAVAWDQAMDKIGEAILPVLPVIADAIASIAEDLTTAGPHTIALHLVVAGVAAALGPVIAGIGALISAASALAPLFVSGGAITGGLAALAPLLGPIGIAVAAMAAAWYAFGDKIGPVLSDLKTQVVETLGPPLVALFETVRSALTELWQGPFGDMIRAVIGALGEFAAASLKTFGSQLITLIVGAVKLIVMALQNLIDFVKVIANLLTGDWSAAWEAAGRIVTRTVEMLGSIIDTVFPGSLAAIKDLYNGVKQWLGDKLSAVFDFVMGKVKAVGEAFYNLYDAVVGHSYVPDMVDGIAAEMARLEGVMVAPASKATQKTAEAFKALAAEVAPILDRLFPEAARLRAYEKELKVIEAAAKAGEKKGGISEGAAAEAKRRLWTEFADDKYGKIDILGGTDGPIDIDFDALTVQMQKTMGIVSNGLAKPAKKLTKQVVDDFADMAYGVIDSLDYMVNAISKGNIFDKIVGVLGLIQQIVGVVMQVKGIAAPAPSAGGTASASSGIAAGFNNYGGARAYGGPVVPGKTYRVGERGAEYFTPSTPGAIVPDKGAGRGGNTYQISGNLLTPEFWAEIQAMDEVAAQKGALGGANMVQEQSAKRGRQRLGRGR
mgnify:CR=1 FL=1